MAARSDRPPPPRSQAPAALTDAWPSPSPRPPKRVAPPSRSPGGGGLERWQHPFQTLMPYRVGEVLLISSDYDAFVLEEDGSLADRLYSRYSELNLSRIPRITHAGTAKAARALLEERNFDLVMTVARIADDDALTLCRFVAKVYPRIPIVLLLLDESDLARIDRFAARQTVSRIFQWTGRARSLIAAIKSVEDLKNAEHDTHVGGVKLLLVVEDGIREYSSFLSTLYPILFRQAGSLIDEGLNDFQRVIRLRARPKILLAQSTEEARHMYRRFGDNIIAVLTDVR
ncbi:MAG: hypothetical protein AAGA56_29435, partial [Myxococcota bacterium]